MKESLRYADELELDLQAYAHDSDQVDTAIQSLESMVTTQDMYAGADKALDETSYKLVQHSVESFLKLAKIGGAEKILPSLESYTSRGLDISHASLEGLGEGIKNVFMSIINAIKSALSWVWGLIKKLFGRGKDREEKVAALTTEAEEVKQAAKEMTDEQKQALPHPLGSDGFFTEISVKDTGMLKKIVTNTGLMDRPYLDKVATELARVFEFQSAHNRAALQVSNGYKPEDTEYKPPFPETHDSALTKEALGKAYRDAKVYASMEFGGGAHVAITVPPAPEKGNIKSMQNWADHLHISRGIVSKVPSLDQFSSLKGDQANPDKLIETVMFLNKLLKSYTDNLQGFQKGKELFIRNVEQQIKKGGTNLFSSKEMKNERDALVYNMKYFKRTMDEPALSYYGLCDGVVTTFINLATYALHYNRTQGNHVELKKKEKEAA